MDYSIIHDDHLLRLLKASDEGALREIYLRYWKELYITTLKKLRSREVAEELVQNVIVSIWDKREISSIRNLEGYLKMAIRYQVINFIKGKIHHEKNHSDIIPVETADQFKGESGLLARELSEAIDNATKQLPEKTRLVFRLSRYEEHSVKEIARSMNISEKAVEYHITKSLKILRLHLKDFIFLLPLFMFLFT
jgi:RNA polymerase sigma-70 factor (ECF subfamily)